MPYRGTLLFQHNNPSPPAGFSETWEWESSSDDIAGTTLEQLAQQRVKILSEDWTIIGSRLARLESAGPGGPILQVYVSTETCVMNHIGELGAGDMVQAAVRYKINPFPNVNYAGARPRQWQVRGIPDDWWASGSLSIPKAADVKINGFLGWIIAQQFGHFVLGDGGALVHIFYRNWCGPFPSNRKIGRPFGLLRGRRKCPVPAVP